MIKSLIFSFSLVTSWLCASESEAAGKIFAYLKIHDPHTAVEVAQELLQMYPDSKEIRLAYVQALAEKGDETAVFREWNLMRSDFQKDRNALEILAWSVLKKGELSPQVYIHLSSLIGAALTRDVRAIPMMISALRSSSAALRLFGVRFAAELGDGALQQELARLMEEEKVWFVRQEVIRAVGQLRILSLKPQLVKTVSNPRTLAEEKVAAILALVQMYDGVRGDDLQKLLTSHRAGLRQLACELIGYYELSNESAHLKKLLNDSSPDVRAYAIRTLGLLQEKIDGATLKKLQEDSHPQVAITAAWTACRQGDAEGVESLKKWLSDIHPRWRWMAAAMLPQCGPMAYPVIKEQLGAHEDRFVRANLALGLMGQRVEIEKACLQIDHLFQDAETGRLMWDDSTSIRMIVPNVAYHIEQVQNYPLMIDQLTRLDLLNMLCVLKYPKAQETVKEFVKKETWGVTGSAVALLLQEGDEEALQIIRELMKESEAYVRVQAALMLAIYGNDPAALQVLQESYVHVDRETKIQILEAIGHIGTQEAIPFLVNILGEPFQMLRVVAASAIIQCLYH